MCVGSVTSTQRARKKDVSHTSSAFPSGPGSRGPATHFLNDAECRGDADPETRRNVLRVLFISRFASVLAWDGGAFEKL